MKSVIVIKPRLSEKTYALSENLNVFTFDVPKSANKYDVFAAVKRQYEVSPLSIRMANVSGKPQRSIRRRGKSIRNFHRANFVKAYVTLKEGDKLPIFAAIESDGTKPDKGKK
jgi:ribosomal protein L23